VWLPGPQRDNDVVGDEGREKAGEHGVALRSFPRLLVWPCVSLPRQQRGTEGMEKEEKEEAGGQGAEDGGRREFACIGPSSSLAGTRKDGVVVE